MLRTHHCGELTAKHAAQKVALCGWVDTRRDHGNLIFIDLRDRWGKTQLVFDPERNKTAHEIAERLRPEYVVRVEGSVVKRPKGTVNTKIPTGEIEIDVKQVMILNTAETPPFEISDGSEVSEELRLTYRYLDLRRKSMQDRLSFRDRVAKAVRDYFHENQFLEVETPMLTKSTPEGARDFLVPARLASGCFYALPQSPQLFKQILMVSGFDRYFQLARCFRDEDLRADRQPEHTQIDVEMSFVEENDVMATVERLLVDVLHCVCKQKVKAPFERLAYEDALNRFGSDKPDIRFGLELVDATDLLRQSELNIFKQVVQSGGVIKGLKISDRDFARSDFDELIAFAQGFGAKGLAWLKVLGEKLESPIAKFLSDDEQKHIVQKFQAKPGDTIFLVADRWLVASAVLGALRCRFGRELGLIESGKHNFLWVVDFPLFEWNEEEKRLDACHHPFTAPRESDVPLFETQPLQMKARAYDLILNGVEIGGGSIRIHQADVQNKVFRALKISAQEAEEKFGFLLKALRYGAPPHGGIALGLDRLCAIVAGLESIRDVIAFPKTQKGTCLMTEAPSKVYPKQLKELHLQVKS